MDEYAFQHNQAEAEGKGKGRKPSPKPVVTDGDEAGDLLLQLVVR